jgi:hypothetical protein
MLMVIAPPKEDKLSAFNVYLYPKVKKSMNVKMKQDEGEV